MPLEKTPGTSWCRWTSFQLSFGSFVSFSFSFDCSLFLPWKERTTAPLHLALLSLLVKPSWRTLAQSRAVPLSLTLSFCQDPVTRLRRELRRRITFVPFSAFSLFPLSSFLKKTKTILPKERITGQAQFKEIADGVYQDCLSTTSLGSPPPGRPGLTSVIIENKDMSLWILSSSGFGWSHAQWGQSSPG